MHTIFLLLLFHYFFFFINFVLLVKRPGGCVTKAVGTIFRNIFVGTCARPI